MKRTEAFERRCAMDLCHHPPFEVPVVVLHSQNTNVDLRSSTECKMHTRQSSSVRETKTFKEKPSCSDEDCGDCDNSTAPTTRHHHHLLDSSLQCDDQEKDNEEMLTMALPHNKEQFNKQKRNKNGN